MYTVKDAIILSVAVSSSYVLAIYLNNRSIKNLPRDHPTNIKGRIRNVSVANLIVLFTIPIILAGYGAFASPWATFKSFGMVPGLGSNSLARDIVLIIKSIVLIVSLYVGPIINYFYENGVSSLETDFKDAFCSIWGIRNHVFAPITEELIYTSVTLSIFAPLSVSTTKLICLTPILFGVAHLHHGYELYKTGQYTLKNIMISCVVQLTYTTLFGMLTNFIFLRTNNCWCCISIHCFCNLMGFPTLTVDKPWRWVYYGLLAFGVFLFKTNLYVLTE